MTAVSRRNLAHHAISMSMVEIAQAEPRTPAGDVAYQLARATALELSTHRGRQKAAADLVALADEIRGAG